MTAHIAERFVPDVTLLPGKQHLSTAVPPGSQRHGGRAAWFEDTFRGPFKV